MKAIILSAGYATRLYPLTKDTPKALLPIGGKAMLDYLVGQIEEIGAVDEIHIISNHRFYEQFCKWADDARAAGRYAGMELKVWDDGTTSNENRLGAVGDIAFTLEHAQIDDDLLVAASDNFFTFPLKNFYDDFKRHGCDTILATRLKDIEEMRRMAIAELDENGRVRGLEEKPQNPKTDIGVFALYMYRKDTIPLIFRYLQEGNNPDAPGHLPEWLYKVRDVRAYQFTGECVDIGTVDAYHDICEKYKDK